MAIRLTLILIATIFVVMRFGGGPMSEPDSTEVATISDAPPASAPEAEEPPVDPIAATPAVNAPAVTRLEPVPETLQEERITLAPPPVLAPADDDAEETEDAAFSLDQDGLISPLEALPGGIAGAGTAGLSGALSLRDQVDAALTQAQDPPARPSLAELAQPGGGQLQPSDPVPPPEPETAALDPQARYAEVTATAVNLRGGPSTLNDVVGQVSFGDVLEIRGEFSGGWSAIRHPDTGETAYISSQFLAPFEN